MLRWIFLSSLLALCQGKAVSPKTAVEERIVGGFPIDIRQVPYQVSLQNNGHFCGGTLVSPTVVITAAHCTFDKSITDVSVRIGSNYHNRGGVVIPASNIVEHPNYDEDNQDYDIAIIILSTPETWTAQFPRLPSPVNHIKDGDWAMVSGWGATQDPAESTDVLRAVFVPMVNRKKCDKLYGGITPAQLCAGDVEDGGVDSCQGDSGGPLTLNGYLIGVVSWGEGCAEPGFPGVYTSVAAVRRWIMETVNL